MHAHRPPARSPRDASPQSHTPEITTAPNTETARQREKEKDGPGHITNKYVCLFYRAHMNTTKQEK